MAVQTLVDGRGSHVNGDRIAFNTLHTEQPSGTPRALAAAEPFVPLLLWSRWHSCNKITNRLDQQCDLFRLEGSVVTMGGIVT
jgi:hypothetical protein